MARSKYELGVTWSGRALQTASVTSRHRGCVWEWPLAEVPVPVPAVTLYSPLVVWTSPRKKCVTYCTPHPSRTSCPGSTLKVMLSSVFQHWGKLGWICPVGRWPVTSHLYIVTWITECRISEYPLYTLFFYCDRTPAWCFDLGRRFDFNISRDQFSPEASAAPTNTHSTFTVWVGTCPHHSYVDALGCYCPGRPWFRSLLIVAGNCATIQKQTNTAIQVCRMWCRSSRWIRTVRFRTPQAYSGGDM